jgi:hypothetical protein
VRLWVAGSFGSGRGTEREEFLAEAGLRRRLLSFAEIDDTAIAQHRFWVQARGDLMRVYFAGNVMGGDPADHAVGVANRLLTFADVDSWAAGAFEFWIKNPPAQADVFLDSGAFAASSRGAKIDLGRYCDYILEHQSALACYAALDVIGDWRATRKNVEAMEARGLSPVPTFHRSSPLEVLDELAATHKHIALGGIVTAGQFTPAALQPFLDQCWHVLEKHWPIKVHVFGVITQWVLERYPFYSADSASAIVGAGMGRVMSFDAGIIRSVGWADYVKGTWDGGVADGMAMDRAAKGSAHAGRRRKNIQAQLALERYVTDLWTSRGVVWA